MHDDLSLLAMAENGLGCTILPALLINNYPHKAVVKRLETDPSRLIALPPGQSDPLAPYDGVYRHGLSDGAGVHPSQDCLLD